MKIFAKILLIGGVFLIILNLYGYIRDPSVKYDRLLDIKYKDVSPIPGYTTRVRDLKELKALMQSKQKNFDLNYNNTIVFECIRHTDQRKIELYENWLLWVLGKVYSPLERIQNPNVIVNGGVAICSEAAIVLNHLAKINDLDARFIYLNGHVISEVKTSDGWIAVDPDFGITYTISFRELEKMPTEELRNLLHKGLKRKGFSDDVINKYVSLVKTPPNIIGRVGQVQSIVTCVAEQLAEVLKWIIPSFFLILGLALTINKSRK